LSSSAVSSSDESNEEGKWRPEGPGCCEDGMSSAYSDFFFLQTFPLPLPLFDLIINV
jgi:hypothetical protein